MNKIELLAPAGNLEKAKIAILYGADAVYIGGKQFSLRSRASNFSIDEIAELVKFANAHNSHVHVRVFKNFGFDWCACDYCGKSIDYDVG